MTLMTITVFAILLAPFAIFMALLYARSRRPLTAPDRPKSPSRSPPVVSQRYLAAAAPAAGMGVASHAQRIYANVWIDAIIWFLVPLFLGAALGHWQAGRMAKVDPFVTPSGQTKRSVGSNLRFWRPRSFDDPQRARN